VRVREELLLLHFQRRQGRDLLDDGIIHK